MSVFRNSFDGYARNGERYLPAAVAVGVLAGNVLADGVSAVGEMAGELAGELLTPDPVPGEVTVVAFDPPADVTLEAFDGGKPLPLEPFAAEPFPSAVVPPAFVPPDPFPVPDAPPMPIGSPADRWLSGHEFSGHLCSGTIDPTGQGNDVIMYDGHVLDLP